MSQPGLYRGKVVPVKGRLVAVRRWETPANVFEISKKSASYSKPLTHIYEGFVQGPGKGTSPYCIVLTSLPPGVEVSETLNADITFYGYFIKKLKYSLDGPDLRKADRISPLLVGAITKVEEIRRPRAPAPAASRACR